MPRFVTVLRRSGRLFLVPLALSAVLFSASSATAQGKGKKDPKTEALELFEQSADLYRQGKFDEAASLLERAYSLHEEPVLLYNLGRAYEGLGQNEKAIDAYTKYLEKAPKAKDRGALERRIETLKAQIEKEKKAAEPGTPPPAPLPEKPAPEKPKPDPGPATPGPSVLPWVVAGVGVAAIGAGVFVGIQAKSKRDDAQNNPVSKDAEAEFDSAKSMATTANILLIGGTVVAAGGVTWALLGGGKKAEPSSAKLHLRVVPGGIRLGGTL